MLTKNRNHVITERSFSAKLEKIGNYCDPSARLYILDNIWKPIQSVFWGPESVLISWSQALSYWDGYLNTFTFPIENH